MRLARAFRMIMVIGVIAGCGEETGDGPPIQQPEPEPDPLAGAVVINEVLIGPSSQRDWVELVNASEREIDLAGVRLRAVSLGNPGVAIDHQIIDAAASAIEPGGLWMIEGGAPSDQPGTCTRNFQLPDGPIELTLHGSTGRVIDRVVLTGAVIADMRPGISLGRFPDGAGEIAPQRQPTPSATNAGPAAVDPCLDGPAAGAFDDHTVPCIGNVDSFFWLAGSRAGTTTVKFNILPWRDPASRHIQFLDTVFYSLHDEWYFFRMLNGQPVAGETLYSPYSGEFATIDEIYAWALASGDLPHDDTFLRWSGDRLTSARFYDLALDIQPRLIGAGTLIHIPERTEPARAAMWGFELEYRDEGTHADLMVYFDALEASVPEEIFDNLVWIVRSPAQEALAVEMEQNQLRHHDRIVRYTELSVPGETEVYHGGLVAGRVRVVRAGEPGIENATTTDILVLEEIPDYLPPCRALITAVPQTPLAHINLLAKSRGIPNLYIGDVVNDPAWDQWGRVRARVALRAVEPGQYEVVPMTEEQYDTWRDLDPDADRELPAIDVTNAPRALDLAGESVDDMHALRPLIGGKSAGFLPLLSALGDVEDTTTPDTPMAITVRAYNEHIAQFRSQWLDNLLAMTEFRYLKYRRDRYLILEGPDAYDQRYATPSGQVFKQEFLDDHPPGNWLGNLVRAGGVRNVIATTPIDPALLGELETALRAQFSALADDQGLRFRSSSNVEDIEGFNGAGLYQSNTGFLYPDAQQDADDRARTIESALLKTWASYWSWEAYDERLAANIDHVSGNMGVLVHARFDDDRELSNGVFTMTRFPETAPIHAPDQFGARYEMTINAQIGEISVTNPPPGMCVLPEVIRITLADGDIVPRIERLQGSSEVMDGIEIVPDAAVLDLFTHAVSVTDQWLGLDNADLPAEQAHRTVTLDFEFRQMGQGWPSVASGAPYGERMIVKQVRSLEPATSSVPDAVAMLPVPRDVLARGRLVTRRVCTADRLTLTAVEVATDSLRAPDLGYDVAPFTAEVRVEATSDVSELGWTAGTVATASHVELASFDHPGMLSGEAWNLAATVADADQASVGFATLSWTPDGMWTLSDGTNTATGSALDCTVDTLHATPDNYLLDLLTAAQ